jgi:N-acetylmuramoyl-L-alanine amidase
MILAPSPNFDARPDGVEALVLHYTGMQTGEAALARLCDKAAKVSCHYLVEEDGTVYQLVEEQNRAWHAGVSAWRGVRGLNDSSIGIEIVNPGHEWGYRAFPQAQMDAVLGLCKGILVEESPGSTGIRCRLTAGGGDPRDSATENKPPGPNGALHGRRQG